MFDGQGTEPWQPDCKDYKPLNVYGQTKLEGELAVSQTLEKYFIVRIAWVFGLNGKNFIKTMLNVGKTHDTVRVVNDQIGTPTYTYDFARLLVDMNETEKYGYYHPIVYIMACRIGPFAGHFYKEIHKLGGTVYLNPDGHEWMRAKWSAPIRKYWKISEQMMVKYCDLAICDSVNIEKYIHECYDGKGIKGRNPKTTFIAYGADLTLSKLADDDEKLVNWYKENGLTKKDYYLVVGRFVPENSFEVMIREFMKSKSKKNFAIITNVNEKFLNELEEKLHFKSDKRIKFVGTVYDQELLKKIRENAYGYAFNFCPYEYLQ